MLRVLLIILSLSLVSSVRAGSAEPRIGVIAGFSGDSAAYGAAYRRGIELAGLEGKATFLYEDDGFIPAKTISAFRKLVDIDKVSTVIVGDTVTSQAVASIAKSKKISLLGWASADRAFLNNPYALRLWTTNERDYGYVAEEVVRHGYKKVALFTSTHTYASGWGEALHKRFGGSSWDDFSKAPESFQTYILKIKRDGYDAVGLCLSPGLNGLFAKQMRNLNVSLPRFACDFVEASSDIDAADGTFDGLWFTAPRITPAFVDRYRSAFKVTDHLVSAALFHDAALLAAGVAMPSFAIEGIKVVDSEGDRHLDFPFATFTFKGAEISLTVP
jgi:ABC-type branched-subunit amino acid transport system substrate-binding protein